MNLQQLDILARSIRAKDKIVNSDTLILESLFHNFGTLDEYQANNLLWEKREYFYNKFPQNNESIIHPASLAFLGWSNDIPKWMK